MIAKLSRLTAAEIEGLRTRPGSIFDLMKRRKEVVDIGHAWDGILWLVSEERRDRWPAAALPETQSLVPPGSSALGGARVRWARPSLVPVIAAALDAIDDASLRAHFDPAAMRAHDVQPDVWDEAPSLEHLVSSFERLRKLYRQAAKAGDGVLVVIA